MRCDELDALLTRVPSCELSDDGGARLLTHCLYPSADPVHVYVSRWGDGFRVSDGGGAIVSALQHVRSTEGMFEKARRQYSVDERDGILVAEPVSAEWLWPAILAVANASAMAAQQAVEVAQNKSQKALKSAIFNQLSSVVPEKNIASGYEFKGRSGHLWPLDYAVLLDELILIKTVVQNGNSINSNYATFGDIGDDIGLSKFCVHDAKLKPDSTALLRQVATLMPPEAVSAMTARQISRAGPSAN
jgi:hypothetical protein